MPRSTTGRPRTSPARPAARPDPKEHDVALAQMHALLALTATLAEATQVPFDRTPEFPLFDR